MSRLPSPEDLAKLVSYVFDVMLTLHCELVGRRPVRDGETARDRLHGLAWLVNMIGGQVRSAIAKDHSLGLARIDLSADQSDGQGGTQHECVVLRAGSFELAVQVSE